MSKITDLKDPVEEWIPGAVEFNDYHQVPWSEGHVIGVHGEVRVISAEQATGFAIEGGGHANWLALVRGPSGAVHVIPGCKVCSVTYDVTISHRQFVAVP